MKSCLLGLAVYVLCALTVYAAWSYRRDRILHRTPPPIVSR